MDSKTARTPKEPPRSELLKLQAQTLETLPEALDFDFTGIDQLVGWQKPPTFTKMGRSATWILDEPLEVTTDVGSLRLSVLKLKGIGLSDHRGALHTPRTTPYHRIHPHLGFTTEGDCITVRSAAAPLGGLQLERARAEYTISESLLRKGCPSQVPLRLYRYDEPTLRFRNDGTVSDLGVIVTGFPTCSEVRADAIFELAHDPHRTLRPEHASALDRWAVSLGVARSEHRALALLGAVGAGFCATLRRFHEAGFYRYSGMADNYAYSPETGEVFLIDLDSSRPLAECSSVEAPLQILRDVASALYGLVAHMLRRHHLQHYRIEALRQIGFFPRLLRGYFHEVAGAASDQVADLLEDHYRHLWRTAERRHASTPEIPIGDVDTASYFEARRARRRQTWIDREATYSLLMAVLHGLYSQSLWNLIKPQQLGRDPMLERIATYTTPQVARSIRRLVERLPLRHEPSVLAPPDSRHAS